MKKKKPTISICIPTFNRAELLRETLKSVAAQTVKPFEVLIIDNASTDNTKKVVNEFKKYGFRYLANKKNVGMVENWNICIKQSKGEFLSFLHSDDLISPNWYESWIAAIKKYNVSFYTCSMAVIDEVNHPKYVCHTFYSNRLIKQPNVVKEFWTHGSPGVPLTGATIFKKELFKEFGYFNPAFRTEADVPMGYNILSKKDVFYLDKVLFAYRSHKQQGFDKQQSLKNIKEELKRLDNYFKLMNNFYRTKLSMYKNPRFFIQHALMMNLAPVNLYLVKLQFNKVLGFYKAAWKYFPELFKKPSDWFVLLKYQLFFIRRALLIGRLTTKEKKEVCWLQSLK